MKLTEETCLTLNSLPDLLEEGRRLFRENSCLPPSAKHSLNYRSPDPERYSRGEWQERISVVELPHGASTIAANVCRWLLKSEDQNNWPLMD